MRIFAALVTLLALAAAPPLALAQEPPQPVVPVVESAEVTGISIDDLSPGLRQEIAGLAGRPLDRDRLNALAARIEAERPDVIAAVRDVAQGDARVRVVFLVARISDRPELAENINARYIVESADIRSRDGDDEIADRMVVDELRKALQTLVGEPLDPDHAERLRHRIADELPDYDVSRRMSRGSQPGHIRVVFELSRSERSRWLRFSPSRSKVVYHEQHGWSGVIDVDLGGRRDNQVTLGFVLGNDDDLVEEYSGYRFRFENRRAGTDRLGVSFEVASLSQDWRDVTLSFLDASPEVARAYDRRVVVDPRVTVAATRHLRVVGGVSVSQLRPLTAGAPDVHAHAFVAGAGYAHDWARDRDDGVRHALDADYELRAGAEALNSDLDYRRHHGHVRYRVDGGRTTFIADFRAGHTTGQPPLFERFTLGDTTTLRGWNKYDIAPAGARRMWHQSVEFRYHGLAWFLDAGALWDDGIEHEVRLGSGVGLHGDWGFVTLAFPLNADDVSATFMIGARF